MLLSLRGRLANARQLARRLQPQPLDLIFPIGRLFRSWHLEVADVPVEGQELDGWQDTVTLFFVPVAWPLSKIAVMTQ